MSRDATSLRPFARMGWGGRAASHWRGLIQTDQNDFLGRTIINRGQVGTVIYRSPGAAVNYRISGVTRDSGGAILANCRVELMITGRDVSIAEVISGSDGSFAFDNPGTGPFYLVAYKVGSPDVAGTTINTIVAELVVPPVNNPTISAPVITRTTPDGVPPEVDIIIPSNVWAGYYLNIERSATGVKDGSGAYTVPTMTVSYQIQPSDLPSTRGGSDGGIPKTALVEDGYVDPTGLYYQQYWFSREDGARSSYSNEITDTVVVATTVFHTTNGVNKNQYVDVTARTASMTNIGLNAESLVRATQAAGPTLFVYEVLINALDTASTPAYIFIEDGTKTFGPSVFGIPSVGVGLEINKGTGTTYIINNGGFAAGGTLDNGDIVSVVVNKTTKAVSFYRTRSGTTTQIGATQTASGTFTNWYAALGFKFEGSLTANFGQTAFARALDSGYAAYG